MIKYHHFQTKYFTMRQSTTSVSTFRERIVFLDYLRIFAFASVLVGHKFYLDLVSLSLQPSLNVPVKILIQAMLPFCERGGAGVVVFFLVSGYIITSNINQNSSSHFLIKRFFRIYPLYWCAVFIQWCLLFKQRSHPSVVTLLKQLSLFGDFWGTPYSLNGVEWTLRVEIIFYLLIAAFQTFGLTRENLKRLPIALFLVIILCELVSPFPTHTPFSLSYCTTYGPFLPLGGMLFLFETKIISSRRLCIFTGLIFAQYFYNISKYQPSGLSSPFALLGFAIFLLLWFFRTKLPNGYLIVFLSELTYSVYLFHAWLFDYFYGILSGFHVSVVQQKLISLFVLMSFCYLVSKAIEKPGLRIGKTVIGRY